ncbi:hypothetical protein DHEL01_v200071 [Diaporthe helianthi]|uniref:Protein kinase domain-containing protein n=1 Tax=Diaporthe helianthi TaxID=158607 RepID=A0A2P5IGC2_DIAHE|nr:hypothetical protein DHEL01_v200071 [Diaporthe helianthi]
MAASRGRVYRQIGVFLPLERHSDDLAIDPLQCVRDEAAVPARESTALNAGFLYVGGIQLGSLTKRRPDNGDRIVSLKSIFIVQSVSTGELFVNKIIERPYNATTDHALPPLELRCSTYRHRIDDPTVDRPANVNVGPNGVVRKGVLPDVPCFNKLRFWQELLHKNSDGHPVTVFSMFFELVAEQLFLAIVAMKLGRYTVRANDGTQTTVQVPNWTRVYHRDLHANNVFINYVPKGPGRIPRVGLSNNAFPEIVVGDLGNSGVDGDDPAIIPQAVYQPTDDDNQDDDGYLYEWEDIYSTGEILRKMAMTHSASERANNLLDMRPDNLRLANVNGEATAPPYSADLINMLTRFEFPNMENIVVRDIGDEAAINSTFPSVMFINNTLLPLAQRKVLGYLDPAGKPAGYFDTIDVSWTRPADPMPFSYMMKYATDAGELPDGRPHPDDGLGRQGGSHSGSGSGSSSDGDGDVGMPDSPPGPRASPAPGSGHDGSNGASDDGSQQPGTQAGSDGGYSGSSSSVSSSPAPPRLPADQLAMQNLSRLHKWDTAKPRYELRSLEFGRPTILPLKFPPP